MTDAVDFPTVTDIAQTLTLTWPERPLCHGGAESTNLSSAGPIYWRQPDPQGRSFRDDNPYGSPYGYPFQTCAQCGSLSARDLFRYLTDADLRVLLDMADWKYGWPHKFYVEGIPNPKVGQQVSAGSRYGPGDNGKEMIVHLKGPAPAYTHAKFYNRHLLDLNPSAFEAVVHLLRVRSGIRFNVKDGRLGWAVEEKVRT